MNAICGDKNILGRYLLELRQIPGACEEVIEFKYTFVSIVSLFSFQVAMPDMEAIYRSDMDNKLHAQEGIGIV